MSGLPDRFEPDEITLELLGSEHDHGTWFGREALPVANRIRNQGGGYDDYIRWMLSSHLWTSYTYSTSDKARDQDRHLESAWAKAERSKPFDLEEWLTDLQRRIATSRWTGRAGSRNREVALAFVGFCIDNNCFTRTISKYELSKHTPGLSPSVVGRGLADLVEIGLLRRMTRDDLTRQTKRSTNRYRVNLYWQGDGKLSVNDLKNTGKHSLGLLRTNGQHDLWSSRGLGLTAGRVHEALTDEPATLAEVAQRAGITRQSAHRALERLADACLAGILPGRPARYFAVETPLDVLAEALGCAGYVERRIAATEILQAENRERYAGAYRYDTRSPEPEVRRQVPRPKARHVPPPPEEWFAPILAFMDDPEDRIDPGSIPDPFKEAPVDESEDEVLAEAEALADMWAKASGDYEWN
jgi:hypothetical protein